MDTYLEIDEKREFRLVNDKIKGALMSKKLHVREVEQLEARRLQSNLSTGSHPPPHVRQRSNKQFHEHNSIIMSTTAGRERASESQ
jgi:hypothetical protein